MNSCYERRRYSSKTFSVLDEVVGVTVCGGALSGRDRREEGREGGRIRAWV